MPQAVVQVVQRVHADALVDLANVGAGHFHLTDGQGVLLALGHDRHNLVLVHIVQHFGAGRRQTRAHDVRPAEHEFYGTLVNLE